MVLHGPEPDFTWRQFGKAVANIAASIGVTTTYSMGAYPAPMPHSRPMRISSTASDAEMLNGLDHTTGLIRVPVGVQVAITEELERFGVPSHGLYAQVPYYLATNDWPQAAVACLTMFEQLSGLSFDQSALVSQVPDALAAVEAMLDDNPALNDVVERLEKRYDDLRKLEDDPLPSGDELEEELQQYLRKIEGE
jgi:predicted ATP-grasp superfamily ATP-dependent carboligase